MPSDTRGWGGRLKSGVSTEWAMPKILSAGEERQRGCEY